MDGVLAVGGGAERERERETAQLKGWSRGQIDDARELSGAAWWFLAIGCGFPRHALTEDDRRAAKASLDMQHAKTGKLADCPGRKPDCPGIARIFGVVTVTTSSYYKYTRAARTRDT